MLFVPGANQRAIAKAPGLGADAIMYDLEDSLNPATRTQARLDIAAALPNGATYCLVRVNGVGTPDHSADLAIAAQADAVILPKIEHLHEVETVAENLAIMGVDPTIWVMIESPMGVLNMREIVAHPAVQGVIVGPNDLTRTMGVQTTGDRTGVLPVLSNIIVTAKAYGATVIDGVYNAFRDTDGFLVETTQGRALGFDGKSLIHPAQVKLCKSVYAPSEADLIQAKRVIEAYESGDGGVTSLDGEMIEELHVHIARRMLLQGELVQ
jgi:citrate lyase beta subunit